MKLHVPVDRIPLGEPGQDNAVEWTRFPVVWVVGLSFRIAGVDVDRC